MKDEDLTRLNNNIMSPDYIPCDLTVLLDGIEIASLTNAGARYKGNGSRWSCMDDKGRAKLSGACRKISFKIDTNEFSGDK